MQADPGDGGLLAGTIALVAIAAAVWTFPISIVLMHLYRRRVSSGMQVRASNDQPAVESSEPSLQRAAVGGEAFRLVRLEAPEPGFAENGGDTIHANAQQRARRAACVYGCAGLAFALVIGVSYMSRAGVELHPFPLLVVTAQAAWPVLLSVGLVAAASLGEQLRMAAVYFGVLLLLGGIALTRSESLSIGQLLILWPALNATPTLVLALTLRRAVRAVAPLVLAFLVVTMSGLALPLLLIGGTVSVRNAAVEAGLTLGLGATVLLLTTVLAGAVLVSPLAYAGARWIGWRYERKRISDQSILLDALWLVFAVSHTIVLVAAGGAGFLLSGALAFVAYKAVALAAFSTSARHGGAAPRLLVLRAFSLGKRSERLFRALETRWRHVGSVQLICGPDLASTTVEPHEFLDFMHGRLSRRFIDGPEALDQRLSEIDLGPDPDGRFRVNEFFCTDDMWRDVFARLLSMSDAILIDLRGFTRLHGGLTFEVHEIVRTARLERVVALIDEGTDAGYVEEIARQAWGSRPPGLPSTAVFTLVPVRSSGEYRTVFAALSAALQPQFAHA